MSPRASEEAVSSQTSPATLIDQQQILPPPSAVEGQQQTVPPPSAVEDQLRKEIAGLEAEIRQLKLNQDPNREGVKHTLLWEELAQIRETNLNLRVELQVVQEGHRLLEEKYHALETKHERCRNSMQEALKSLSTAELELSNEESTIVVNNGSPNAVQIKVENHPPAVLTVPVQANIFGQPSIRFPAEQPLTFTPGPFQRNQPHLPTPLFLNSGLTPSHFLAKVSKPAPPMFGNPRESIHDKSTVGGGKSSTNAPDFGELQQRVFAEVSRRDKTPNTGGIKPPATSQPMFNHMRTSAPSTSRDSSSSCPGPESLEQSKKRKFGNQGGW